MNKLGKKLLVASLCACMAAASLTGCGAKEDKTVVTVGDTKASFGLVNLMLRFNQAQMQSLYGSFMGEDMWANYGEITKENVVQSLENMMLMEQHMEEYGVSISDEEKTKIADAAKKFVESNDDKTMKAMSATTQNVERMLTLYTVEAKMYNAIIADVDTNVTDEEAVQKTVQYVLFSTAGTTDEEGNNIDLTEEQKVEKKNQAEKLLEAVKGGTDMKEAMTEIGEDRSPVSSTYGAENGSLIDELKEVADTLADGEVADSIIETDGGYYVLQMMDTFDEEKTETQKETIVSQRKSDKYTETIDAWKEDSAISAETDLLTSLDFVDKYELKVDETESEVAAEDTEEASETGSEAETTEAASETGTEAAATEESTTEVTTEETTEETTTEAVTTEETTEAENTETASETEKVTE